jgi:DNA-binding GntR family transcriptional regulator
MPTAKPKRLLKDDAYQSIKRMIIVGNLPPGELLSERKLSRALGISGSPVRAAIERLGVEGFVCISPQRGTFVLDLSINEIAELFEFRIVIESYIARRLAGDLNDEQVEQLRRQLAEQRSSAAAEHRDLTRDVELDMQFHLMLCRFFGNQEMAASLHRLRDKTTRAVLAVNWRHDERLPVSIYEHTAIADAIIQGDGRLAEKRMKEHLEFGRDFLMSGEK